MIMKYSAEEFSLAGDKYLGRSYDEMDCQTFVERCMADVGLRMDLGGSNSWYREVMKNGWTGTPEECVNKFGQIPKGALIFIWEPVSASTPAKFRNDGIGDITHMGIKTGRNDGAIHSSHSRHCVATSKFKDKTIKNGGWNRVGLYNKFDYGKSVNWFLEHGEVGEGQGNEEITEDKPMHGITTAQSGSSVNIRKKKDGDLLDRVPLGTDVEVIDYGPEWCKVKCRGMIGWLKTELIAFDDGIPGDSEPVQDPAGQDPDEDFNLGDLLEDDEMKTAAANAYPFLKLLVEKIEERIGKG